jgi:hypothetical protein
VMQREFHVCRIKMILQKPFKVAPIAGFRCYTGLFHALQ